jgi:enamine deaminase RidA (YjgF/YER057c/UK114 family)
MTSSLTAKGACVTAISTIHEVFPDLRRATVPLGLRVNDLVVATDLNGCDPATSKPRGDLHEQVVATFSKMRELVKVAGGSLANVARAVAYVTKAEDREPVNGPWWHEVFPDSGDRPAYKVVLGDLPPGNLIRLDVMAVLGATRRRIDIPNVSALDPTVVIGDYVISSRCYGLDKNNDSQLVPGGLPAEARQTFYNPRELASIAGGSAQDIVQVNTYGSDESYIPEARAAFDEVFADSLRKPELHTLINVIAPERQIAADMIAVTTT